MFIYVSGPYSSSGAATAAEAAAQVRANIESACRIGIALAQIGHTPFIPHMNCQGWEDVYGVDRRVVMRTCGDWVARCDALYFIAPSPGANWERGIAEKLGKPVFESIGQVPVVPS